MARFPGLLSLVFTVPLVVSVACGPRESDDPVLSSGAGSRSVDSASSVARGDGWRRTIEHTAGSAAGYAAAHPFALGARARFQVSDTLVGATSCTVTEADPSQGCNGGPGSSSCSTPTEKTDSTVESVVCAGACAATAEKTSRGTFAVDVVASEAGAVEVTVKLRDRGGLVLETTASLVFARPTHIGVTRKAVSSPHGLAYAALPGASFEWCFGLDANGAPLAFDRDALSVGITGALRERPVAAPSPSSGYPVRQRCEGFVAATPGEGQVDGTFGELVRRTRIRVVAEAEVVADELFVVDDPPKDSDEDLPIEAAPFSLQTAAASVEIDSCSNAHSLVLQRVRTRDGQLALAPNAFLTVDPAELATIATFNDRSSMIGALSPLARGEGTVRAVIGEAVLAIPITVTGSCAPSLVSRDGGRARTEDGDGGLDAAEEADRPSGGP